MKAVVSRPSWGSGLQYLNLLRELPFAEGEGLEHVGQAPRISASLSALLHVFLSLKLFACLCDLMFLSLIHIQLYPFPDLFPLSPPGQFPEPFCDKLPVHSHLSVIIWPLVKPGPGPGQVSMGLARPSIA